MNNTKLTSKTILAIFEGEVHKQFDQACVDLVSRSSDLATEHYRSFRQCAIEIAVHDMWAHPGTPGTFLAQGLTNLKLPVAVPHDATVTFTAKLITCVEEATGLGRRTLRRTCTNPAATGQTVVAFVLYKARMFSVEDVEVLEAAFKLYDPAGTSPSRAIDDTIHRVMSDCLDCHAEARAVAAERGVVDAAFIPFYIEEDMSMAGERIDKMLKLQASLSTDTGHTSTSFVGDMGVIGRQFKIDAMKSFNEMASSIGIVKKQLEKECVTLGFLIIE